MTLLGPKEAFGDFVSMQRISPRHLDENGQSGPLPTGEKKGFDDVLLKAVNSVNTDQNKAADMAQQMIVDPESLDVHDVTIAMAKANLSLSITKEVIDRGVKAYQEIINLR